MKTHFPHLLLTALLGSAVWAQADVTMPAIFSEHMVLQQGTAVPVWGYAEPGEAVKVSFAGQTHSATAGADGKWMVKLTALSPGGGPAEMKVEGRNAITIMDVLVGEVWLGSGQSNMGMTVQGAQNFAQERAAAELPQIRMYTEASRAAETPQTLGKGQWVVCSPDTVGRFSATLFFFGRTLQKEVGGTFGLINSSVGGTPIESWIDAGVQGRAATLEPYLTALKAEEAAFDPVVAKVRYDRLVTKWKAEAEKAKAAGQPEPRPPRDPIAGRARKGSLGGLFNGKIAPLIPYALRGIIWYQGEANGSPTRAPFYQYQLPLLVEDWRARWGQGDLPFAWAQLPNIGEGARDWPLVREAMLKTLRLPHTGMGINIDIGEEKDVHPKNKQEVGRRLAQWALGEVYGRDVATSGPLPAGSQVQGSSLVLAFEHTHGGLVAKGGELRGFTVAGADGRFVKATAKIEGEKVIVSSPEVPQPVAARYSWANWPDGNLYNGAGLPASPFRTYSGK